jgi:hypothetical protein
MAKRTRPVDGVNRRYTWRLYPLREQEEILWQQARMCADLWNALLEMCETIEQRLHQRLSWIDGVGGRHRGVVTHDECWYMTAQGPSRHPPDGDAEKARRSGLPSEYDMGYWITAMLRELPEWRALSTWTPRRVATSLTAAWKAFFRRVREGQTGAEAGYPRYKSRRKAASVPHRSVSGCTFEKSATHPRAWALHLKGVGGPGWSGIGWGTYGLDAGIPALGVVRLAAAPTEWLDVDVVHRGGHWEASAAVAIAAPRVAGNRPVTVRLDLLDGFCLVNNMPDTPPELVDAAIVAEDCDRLQTEFDLRWPRGRRLTDDERRSREAEWGVIARKMRHVADKRRNALHVWSARLVARASVITVIMPAPKSATRSARGDEKQWGAAVADVARVNRGALNFAPAMAAQMLRYKAGEAGIACTIVEDSEPKLAVAPRLVQAVKTVRTASRGVRRPAVLRHAD